MTMAKSLDALVIKNDGTLGIIPHNKSIMNEFTIRYVPYAISVNDKIIKVDMNGLKT